MSVRLRLTRVGGKKDPIWRVVVADQRSPRDGRVIETIGHYNAQTNPSTIKIDEERARSLAGPRGAAVGHRPQAAAHPGNRHLAEPPMAAQRVQELLIYLAQGLVDEPDEVSVERFEEDDGTVVLELAVAREDYGKVIGRGGRTAQALRTVVRAAASEDKRRVVIDIVD